MVIFKYTKIHALVLGLILCLPVLNYSMWENDAYNHLYKAINEPDIEKIKQAINAGLNLNKKSKGVLGTTFLDQAIESAGYSLQESFSDSESRLQILELLLQRGANVNLAGGSERTSLFNAVSKNNPKLPIIDLLLKYGADIDQDIVQKSEQQAEF